MTAIKEDQIVQPSIIPPHQQSSFLECCMCGDSGITKELFRCKVCQFRSQHRYCSNLYPKTGSYKICNWCLSQKEDSKEKSQNSCNSSASCKDNSDDDSKNKSRKAGRLALKGSQRNNNIKLQVMKNVPMIKKPKSPEKSPTTPRRRLISNARLEEKLKSEEISNTGLITRHVFRNKVRRYKLLDEVSS